MQNEKEIDRINLFLCLASPIVAKFVKMLLESSGLQVRQEGNGLGLVFSVKKNDKEARMYLRNLLLEIATLNRDEQPLRFDGNLQDFDFFLAKTARLVQSKLNVLFHFFGEKDINAAIEKISLDARQYERVRIWQIDQKNHDKKTG
jgi:hypothetical protein